jgi:hypothetical protein
VVPGLFKENGAAALDASAVNVWGEGVQATPSGNQQSPARFVGYCQSKCKTLRLKSNSSSIPVSRLLHSLVVHAEATAKT